MRLQAFESFLEEDVPGGRLHLGLGVQPGGSASVQGEPMARWCWAAGEAPGKVLSSQKHRTQIFKPPPWRTRGQGLCETCTMFVCTHAHIHTHVPGFLLVQLWT